MLGMSGSRVRQWPEQGGTLFIRPLTELTAADGDQLVGLADNSYGDHLARPSVESCDQLIAR
jgi:hypothetical protein